MKRGKRHGSRIATAVNAVRRHRRRLSRRGEPLVPVSTAVAVAVREASPRTLKGLAVQGTAIATMHVTAGAWRHRIGLAPVVATGAVLPLATWTPGPTAAGLAVTGVAGLLASQAPREDVGEQLASRRRGLAWWAGGMLVWMGAGALGAHEALTWWQDLIALGVATAPGAVAWWRPAELTLPPVAGAELEATGPMLPAAAMILGQTLEALCEMPRSPIEGGRVLEVLYPAVNVAVARVDLPSGVHSTKIAGVLTSGLEAYLDRAGRDVLGGMEIGAVKVESEGITTIKVTASWSRALDQGILPWRPPAGLPAGRSWLGMDDAREDLTVEMWSVGADGKVSALHMWVIGRNGGGKSTTLRTLLAPGVISGCQLLILVDGKGDSLSELAPFGAGGAVARYRETWRQAIALAYSIMVARQQRLGTPQAWRCPTPTDPLITLVIDECATVLAGLTNAETQMMTEMGRMGRSLGIQTIQSGQIPLVDTVIGGSDWRSQARVILGHGVQDAVHDRIATQSGGAEGPSLLGLPTGRIVVMLDGRIVATRARVAMLREDELATAAASSPRAVLADADRTDHVQSLLDLAANWGTSKPSPVVDLSTLLTEWTDVDVDDNAPTNTNSGTGGRAGTVTPITRPAAQPGPAQADAGATGLRQLILGHLLTHRIATRPELVAAARAAGYSKSGTHKAINQLLDTEQVVEEAGRLAPALWAEATR